MTALQAGGAIAGSTSVLAITEVANKRNGVLSDPKEEGDVTMTEAVLVAHVGACRAQLRAIRPSAANAERIERAESALDRAESELWLFRKNDSRLVANGPQTAA